MHCDNNEAPVDAVLEPLGHAKHVEIADAPVVGENVPTGQTVQDAEPMASLYLPAEHGTFTRRGVDDSVNCDDCLIFQNA